MSDSPKMRTAAPLSPEQIRAIVHADHDRKKRLARARLRRTVWTLTWLLLALAALAVLGHYQLLPDDYRDTCEALGQTCGG